MCQNPSIHAYPLPTPTCHKAQQPHSSSKKCQPFESATWHLKPEIYKPEINKKNTSGQLRAPTAWPMQGRSPRSGGCPVQDQSTGGQGLISLDRGFRRLSSVAELDFVGLTIFDVSSLYRIFAKTWNSFWCRTLILGF